MKTSERRWLWISLLFSLIVLAVILFFTVDSSTFELLKQMNPYFILFALVIHLVALFFWSLRIWFMSRGLGYRVSLIHCINLVYANLLIAAITPSQAGGEPVRIHELYKAGLKVGDATAIVITERILDGIVLGVGGAFSCSCSEASGERLGLSTVTSSISPGYSSPLSSSSSFTQ